MRSDEWLSRMEKFNGWNGPTTRFPDLDKHPDPPSTDRLGVLRDALDLLVDLWPKPGSATVQMETHTWLKLRKVLLAIPELIDEHS